MSKIIETYGVIDKEEKVETLNENILEDSLVLDLCEPFPGYYGETFVKKDKPEMVFLIMNTNYSTDDIFRITKKIKKSYATCFDATPCELFIIKDKFNGIRLRFIDNYQIIKSIQQRYSCEGIKWMKKINLSGNAFIRIYKIFRIEEIFEDIYRDIDDENIYYFSIPCNMDWKDFVEITRNVRNNVIGINYDAAKGFIYYNTITDVIRIYSKKISVSELNIIRKIYCKEISKNI